MKKSEEKREEEAYSTDFRRLSYGRINYAIGIATLPIASGCMTDLKKLQILMF